MVTIKVFLDRRKIKKDNTYPICFRVYYQNKSTTRSAKIDVSEAHWDETKKTIRKPHPNSAMLNKLILKQFVDIQSELLLADEGKVREYLNPTPIRSAKEKTKQTVFGFIDSLVLDLKKDNKIGNAWVYESSKSALEKFHPDGELYFEQIDFEFLDKYNKHLLRGGNI